MDATKFYTKREEKANWITHLLGIMIAIAGTYLLTAKSIVHQNIWALLAFLIFGFGIS